MSKVPRVWTGTGWDTLAVTLPDLSNYSTTTQMNTAIGNSAGLNLISTTTISAASTVQVNNCFTSTYDNYFIDLTLSNIASSTAIQLQLSSNGTGNSSAVYQFQTISSYSSSVAAGTTTNATSWSIATPTSGTLPDVFMYQLNLNRPALADKTLGLARLSYQDTSAPSRWYQDNQQLRHDNDVAYDGLRITMGANSGVLRIYGYRNS